MLAVHSVRYISWRNKVTEVLKGCNDVCMEGAILSSVIK